MMPMPRIAHSRETMDAMRQRLVQIALDLYRREGIEAISFRRVAEAAAISHTLPYRYFDSKEALLAALRTEVTNAFDRHVHALERSDLPPLAHIRSVAHAYIDYVRRWPTDYLLIFAAQATPITDYPDLMAARAAVIEHGVHCVQRAIDAGLIDGDASQVAHLFWMALHGLMSLHVADQLRHGQTIDDLLEPMLVRMLGTPAPAPAEGAAAMRAGAASTPVRRSRAAAPSELIEPRRRRGGPRG